MKRYLVTGGCGFIGSHLVDGLLNLGHEVIVFDNLITGNIKDLSPRAELIIGDILDEDRLVALMKKVDGCFHLAALLGIELGQKDWLGTNRVNLGGTLSVLNAARQAQENKPVPVVYISSCSVYGDCLQLPLSESLLTKPLSAYGADKLSCELHAYVGWSTHHIPNVGLRVFNVYGPRQSPSSPYSGVISIFIHNIMKNKAIHIFGDGEQTRDFVFVDDVANAMIFFMNNMTNNARVFNICTGRSVTINELVDILGGILNVPIERKYLPKRQGDTLHSCGDPSKAATLGYHSTIELEEGLKRLITALKKTY